MAILSIAFFTTQPADQDESLSATLINTMGRGWFTSADWSPDGETLAISTSIGIWLYHIDDLSEPFQWLQAETAPMSSVTFSDDGQYLIAGSWDMRAYIWDISDLSQPRHILRGHRGFVNDVVVHPEGDWVATASTDKTIRLWELDTGDLIMTLEGHDHSVTTITVSIDGRLLSSGSRDKTVRIWDMIREESIQVITTTSQVLDVAFLETSRQLTVLNNAQVEQTYDLTTEQVVTEIRNTNETLSPLAELDLPAMGFHPPVNTLEISLDNTTLAISTGNLFTPDYQVMVRDLATNDVINVLDGLDDAVITLAYHPENLLLATGDTAGMVHLWDYQNDTIKSWEAHDGELLSMTFTGPYTVATGGDDAMVRVWDILSGEQIAEFESPNGPVRNIAFNTNTNFSQNSLDDNLTAYALNDEEENLNLLCSHGDTIGAVALNPDMTLRATATYDNAILLTDVASGEILHTLNDNTNLISDLTFSANGRWIASAGWDKTVRIWDISDGELILTLTGHTRPVTSVRFTADDNQIISGSDDGTVRVWMLNT